jgi:hypothetical protein
MPRTTNLADGIWEDVWQVPRAAAPATTTIWLHEILQDRSSYFHRIAAAAADAVP